MLISTHKRGTLIIMLIALIVLISTYKQGSNFLMELDLRLLHDYPSVKYKFQRLAYRSGDGTITWLSIHQIQTPCLPVGGEINVMP